MRYSGEYLNEISFPIGGIGTGSIGLGGDGRLIDWEIFNRPSKGSINGYSHFAIKAIKNGKPLTYILCGDKQKDFMGSYRKELHSGFGFGPHPSTMCGFPHFSEVEFDGEFPIAKIKYSDCNFPAQIVMTAFNPFIPHDDFNSSIPAAFFSFEICNNDTEKIKFQLAASICNPFEESLNTVETVENNTIIFLQNAGADTDDVNYGDLSVATNSEKVYMQRYWYRGKWQDGIVSFWNDFNSVNNICDRIYENSGRNDTCSLISEIELQPGQKKEIKYILSWNMPNNYNYWKEYKNDDGTHKTWKNYYATVFENSKHTAIYSMNNWDSLYSRTNLFKETLHSSDLPECVIDAVSSNLSVLKSPTVLRLEDGSFYGWEGVHVDSGSCEGICQHVWNYAYALCFLFPELEKSIRNLEFKYSTDTDGRMAFRLQLPLGRKMSPRRACVDGQLGNVIKCYREWKISGDDKWLSDNWGNIKKILEYTWSEENADKWDFDKDGVLEGMQHHTLDMELFGPSSWLEGFYMAALKAGAQMAEYLGDSEKASEYNRLFEKGYAWTKENLFNGDYFIHKCDIKDKSIVDRFNVADVYWNEEEKQIKYQIANGSSIDQILAQWHADIIGLGNIFDKEQILVALKNMMKNNFKENMRGFANPWRLFSLYDESGSVICDYPENVEKPKIPIPYCEETMTGFEYSFAGLLFANNMIEEGIKVVNAVRSRFDGKKRNPWNEFECGSNYARSMASFSFIPILSGFEFDIPNKYIGFNPYKTDIFKCLWSIKNAWGSFEIKNDKIVIKIYEGDLTLKSFGLSFCDSISSVKIDGAEVAYTLKQGKVYFDEQKIMDKMEFSI